MANEEQLAILKQGRDAWNTWKDRNLGVDYDLEGANLDGLDLWKIDFNRVKLENASLIGTNLIEADLANADLYNADLSNAHLNHADLQHADVRKTNFSQATLHGASLKAVQVNETDFSDAILSSVELSYTVVDGAKFNRAYLVGTWLRDIILQDTDFSQATLGETIFSGVDLSGARGLDTLKYSGPCTIDIDTLFRTKTPIPEIFLRGCGVPEILIEYLPSMQGSAIDLYSCFISYSHADKTFARRLHDSLQGRGIRCWMDEKQMNPGDIISEEIHRGIRYWDKVLLCCSKSSLTEKWWVDFEINKALQKERDLMKERGEKVKVLIPLDLDGYLFDPEYDGANGDEIRSRIAAQFKGWKRSSDKFEREVERVIKALRTDGGKEPPPKPKL